MNHIIGPVSRPAPDLAISAWVDYMLEGKSGAANNRFWFAIEPEKGTAIGGLKLKAPSPTGHGLSGLSWGIDELSVDPRYQRQGVGATLMSAAEDWIKPQKDLPQAISLGVETSNTAAIALYHKLGYTIPRVADQSIIFTPPGGNPCYLMVKQIPGAPS